MKMIKLVSSLLAAAIIVTNQPAAISQAEVTYEEKDTGSNMGQSFTSTVLQN